MADNINDTLQDVVIKDGALMREVVRNGETVYEPLRKVGEDPFADTETQPAPWQKQTDSGCEKPKAGKRYSHAELENIALQARALMLKVMSPRTSSPHTDSIQTNSPIARGILKELCMILNEPEWAERIK